MKKTITFLKTLLVLVMVLFNCSVSLGQIASLELGTASQSTNSTGSATFTSKDANVSTLPALSLTLAQQGQTGGNGYVSSKTWNNASLTTTTYWQFTVTATSGYQLSVTALTLRMYRSSTGPGNIALATDADNYASTIGGVQTLASATNSTISFTSLSISGKSSITFRVYAYGASVGTGTLRIGDGTASSPDITLTGTVTSASVTAPNVTTQAAVSIGATSANFVGNITSDGGASITDRGFCYKTSSGVTISDNKTSEGGTATGSFAKTFNLLSVNTQYFYRAYATNSQGTTLGSSDVSFYTLANAPAAPTVNNATTSSLDVTLGTGDGNPSGTTYAIYETSTSKYVQADGTLGASAVWQTSATWGTKTVTGLTSSTSYTFETKAKNGDGTETAYSSTTSLSTAAAPQFEWCNLQWPASGAINLGSGFTVYAQVYKSGVTEAAGAGAGIQAWIGYSTSNTNPNTWTNWVPATFNTQSGINDEWKADLGAAITSSGTYYYASRFQLGSAPYVYGGYNAGGGNFWDNTTYVSGTLTITTPEPSSHATGFTATTTSPTYSSIILNWTDASGAAKYLIKGSDVSYESITAPVDGAAEADGGLVKNVAAGLQTYTFTGLSGEKTYYFKIFPYNESGADINFKTDGSVPQASATTTKAPTLLLSEDFDYLDGTVLTTSGSVDPTTGWSTHSIASPANDIDITVPGLTFDGYVGSGKGGAARVDNTGSDINKAFTAQSSGVLYVASIIKINANTSAGYFYHLGKNVIGTSFFSRVWVNATANGINITNGSTAPSSYITVPNSAPFLLVLKHSFATNKTDMFVLNSFSATEPVTPNVTIDETLTDIGSVALRQYSASQNIIVDGIRVTTTWSDLPISFTGTGDWTESARWNTGSVPGTTQSVVIDGAATISSNLEIAGVTINASKSLTVNAGKQLTVSGALTNNGTLNLLSTSDGTATLTAGSASGTGTTNVSQYLSSARNWYVSSPVAKAVAPAGFTYYQRDEAGSSWTSQPFVAGNTFKRGKGYIALPGAAGSTLTFSGQLNVADTTVALTWSGTASKGFNLIGNPYPCHLTWAKAFTDANASLIEPSIYYRTNSGTVNNSGQWSNPTYNAFSGASVGGATGVIPPMQAVWVRAIAAGDLVLDNKLTRSHQSSNPMKSRAEASSQNLRLVVSDGTYSDEMLIYFNAGASNAYDAYDSPKMINGASSLVPDLYTMVGNEELVINGMNTIPAEIPLYIKPNASTSGQFSLSATEVSNFESGTLVYIKNNKTGDQQLISDGSVYKFDVTGEPSLSIIIKAPGAVTGTDNNPTNGLNVYANAKGQITVTIPSLKGGEEARVYNSSGQCILNQSLTNSRTMLNKFFTAGVYVVKVNETIRKVVVE